MTIKTAVILGYGADVDYLLDNQGLLSSGIELFRMNVRAIDPGDEPWGLPLINPFGLGAAIQFLKSNGLTRVVTIGSLSLKVTQAPRLLLTSESKTEFSSVLPYLTPEYSDRGRRFVQSKFGEGFEFPSAREVLPFLFLDTDVAINRNDELLIAALQDPRSYRKDAVVVVAREPIKILRLAKGEPNVVNRRLYLEKLIDIHKRESIKAFFFNRHRTTIVGINEMLLYAESNGLTLQSFVDA